MIELKSFPFDSIADDREYPAHIFRNYFHKFLSTGVYFGKYKNYGDYSMKVMQNTGLNVKVTKGAGIIKGLDFELETDTVLAVRLGGDTTRKDMIVVKADDTLAERKTSLYVKEGTETSFAELKRTNDIYEICLAKITVKAGSVTIDLDDIEDTRRDEELCGIVTSLIDIDIEDVLDEITNKKDNFFVQLGISTEQEKVEFFESLNSWFQNIQDILDENAATNLLNLINTNISNIALLQEEIETKADAKKIWNVSIDTNWTGTGPFTKTIEIEDMLDTYVAKIYPVFSSNLESRKIEKEEYNKISYVESSNGSITLICDDEKPTTALSIRIEVTF